MSKYARKSGKTELERAHLEELAKKALDPEWQMIHRQMGFASSIADALILLEELRKGEEDDTD